MGQIAPPGLKLRMRHGYSNGLTRLLYGRVNPDSSGSRIDGEFRTLLWVVLILRAVWLLLLSGVVAFLTEVRRAPPAGVLAALAGPFVIWLVLAGIEVIARRMGDSDERRIRSILENLFADVAVGRGAIR